MAQLHRRGHVQVHWFKAKNYSTGRDYYRNRQSRGGCTFVFTTSNAVSLAENSTAVGTFAATDADGDTLTYSLSGTDADKFSISETGELSLNDAADYESQISYNVIITASDGS